MPTIGPNTIRAISPAKTASSRLRLTFSPPLIADCDMAFSLNLGDQRPAEQALRTEDQDRHQQPEGEHVLVIRVHHAGELRLRHAEQQPAQHRARQRADAAQHRGGEGLDADDKADVKSKVP